jgi:uncharacterized membrane protein HdeD (DUF308 family)
MERISEHWWVPILRGVVAIAFGIAMFKLPGPALLAFVYAFGTYALVDGVATVLAVIASPRHGPVWTVSLAGGIFSLLAGVVALVAPGLSAFSLLLLIAMRALVTGLAEWVAAYHLHGTQSGAGVLAVAGSVSILAALALMVDPGAGAITLSWLIGTYAIAYGAVAIALGMKLRSTPPQLRHTFAPLLTQRELEESLDR